MDHIEAGSAIYDRIVRLYPICRSITGDGVRQTLQVIREDIDLQLHEVPTGTPVFDWSVPREWNIRDAYIKDSSGRRVVDFQQSNLHVMSYSTPVNARLSLDELSPHLITSAQHPDWIPYRTSYYQEQWAFCLSEHQRTQLTDDSYDVCIDSTLSDGHLTYGEYYLPGESAEEVLISCHICHPSLCNDNLSGIALATMLARTLSTQSRRRYSYRFLFIPGTIGSITWLARNESNVSRIRHGLVIACVGDAGGMSYKRSRQGNAEIDQAVAHVLTHSGQPYGIRDFSPWGYDERQFNSPAFNLPVGLLSRTPHGNFPQYHTSADNLEFVQPSFLGDSYKQCVAIVDVLENNRRHRNLNPKCEPQLGKRGLYRAVGGQSLAPTDGLEQLWVLNLSDGSHSLLDIADRACIKFDRINRAATVLAEHGLLIEEPGRPALGVTAAARGLIAKMPGRVRAVASHGSEMKKVAAGIALVFILGIIASAYFGTVDYVQPPGSSGRQLFVAPDGRPSNDGTEHAPLDVETVFNNPALVQPGDTIWLRGGIYKVAVTSRLTGEPDAPIVVRQYPGERAILDAASRTHPSLVVRGSDTWYWGFEITDSYPTRQVSNGGYTPGVRAPSVHVYGPRTKLINMIVHDGEQGIASWSQAVDSELYGNLIYNVGFETGTQGQGHSIYVQNEDGVKRIVDNILFNSHSFGVHAYTEAGRIDNIYLEGNTAFNHGLLSREGAKANYLFRSKGQRPQNVTLVSNYGYYPRRQPGRAADLATPTPDRTGCANAVLKDNYLASPGMALALTCQSIGMLGGNTFVGPTFGFDPRTYPHNQYVTSTPTGTGVFVRPNRYEPGRATVTVFNWDRLPTVSIDLTGIGLESGDQYEIRDAQYFFGAPVASGTYRPWRRVEVSMRGVNVAAPVGEVAVQPIHTDSEFGVFVVLKSNPASVIAR